jgi:hypothetical protein
MTAPITLVTARTFHKETRYGQARNSMRGLLYIQTKRWKNTQKEFNSGQENQ